MKTSIMTNTRQCTPSEYIQFMTSNNTPKDIKSPISSINSKRRKKMNVSRKCTESTTSQRKIPTTSTQTYSYIKTCSIHKNKEYYRLYNYFCTNTTEWLNTHSDLCSCLLNLFTTRQNLILSQCVLQSFPQQSIPAWKTRGYSNFLSNDMFIKVNDIQQTIRSYLLKQEDSYDTIRQKLFELAHCQESLGRRLEDLLLHELEPDFFNNIKDQTLTIQGQIIYDELSIELYRKQILVQDFLEKSEDEEILHGKPSGEFYGKYVHVYGEQKGIFDQKSKLENCIKEWKGKYASSLQNLESEVNKYIEINNLEKK